MEHAQALDNIHRGEAEEHEGGLGCMGPAGLEVLLFSWTLELEVVPERPQLCTAPGCPIGGRTRGSLGVFHTSVEGSEEAMQPKAVSMDVAMCLLSHPQHCTAPPPPFSLLTTSALDQWGTMCQPNCKTVWNAIVCVECFA